MYFNCIYACTCIVCDYSYAFVHVLVPLFMSLCTYVSVLMSVHAMDFVWPDLE